jgi:hypothetical protein
MALAQLRLVSLAQINTALDVERELAYISMVSGEPIEVFRRDAMKWCATRVSGAKRSLEFAGLEVLSGRGYPWTPAPGGDR